MSGPKSTKRSAAHAKDHGALIKGHRPETFFHRPQGSWMLVREYPPPSEVKHGGVITHLSENQQKGMRTFEGRVLAVGPDVELVKPGDDVSWMPHDGTSTGHFQDTMGAGQILWLKGDCRGDNKDSMVISTLDHAARAAWVDAQHKLEEDKNKAAADNLNAPRQGRLAEEAAEPDDGLDPQLPS